MRAKRRGRKDFKEFAEQFIEKNYAIYLEKEKEME
jgi:hypothetical protein